MLESVGFWHVAALNGVALAGAWGVLRERQRRDAVRIRLAQIAQAHRELAAEGRAAPTVLEGQIVPPAPAAVPVAGVGRMLAPPMRDLLAQGIIRAGGPLVTDYRDGQPTYGAAAQIFTAGDAGRAGSGKTRTAGFLLGQRVLQGAILLGIDPHSFKPDSLTRLLAPLPAQCWLAPMATARVDMDTVIARAEAELEARRNGGPLFDLVLVIDEYTSFMREDTPLARRMARVVEAVATEGRGMAFNGLIIGQNWKGTRAGGTEVREMLQSSYVHRSWARQARYLVPDNDTADLAETLTPGQAIFCPADDDPVQVAIPYCEAADLATIARLLPPRGYQDGYQPATTPERARVAPVATEVATSVPDVASVATSEAAIAAYLAFMAGDDAAKITRDRTGITSSQGGAYQRANEETQQLIRDGARAFAAQRLEG